MVEGWVEHISCNCTGVWKEKRSQWECVIGITPQIFTESISFALRSVFSGIISFVGLVERRRGVDSAARLAISVPFHNILLIYNAS